MTGHVLDVTHYIDLRGTVVDRDKDQVYLAGRRGNGDIVYCINEGATLATAEGVAITAYDAEAAEWRDFIPVDLRAVLRSWAAMLPPLPPRYSAFSMNLDIPHLEVDGSRLVRIRRETNGSITATIAEWPHVLTLRDRTEWTTGTTPTLRMLVEAAEMLADGDDEDAEP